MQEDQGDDYVEFALNFKGKFDTHDEITFGYEIGYPEQYRPGKERIPSTRENTLHDKCAFLLRRLHPREELEVVLKLKFEKGMEPLDDPTLEVIGSESEQNILNRSEELPFEISEGEPYTVYTNNIPIKRFRNATNVIASWIPRQWRKPN